MPGSVSAATMPIIPKVIKTSASVNAVFLALPVFGGGGATKSICIFHFKPPNEFIMAVSSAFVNLNL